MGEPLPDYEFRQSATAGRRQQQTDECLLEQLQFGDTDHAEAAQRILANDRIRKPDAQYPKAKGDTALEPYYQRALRVRAKNLEIRGQAWDLPADVRPRSAQSQINELSVQQAAPNDTFGPENTIAEPTANAATPQPSAVTPQAPATGAPRRTAMGAVEATVPTDRIRSTFNMSQEELDAVGLPRLQPRDQPYSRQTVEKVRDNYDPDVYDRILVTEGTDGNYYIVSGHSRFEGLRQGGRSEVDVKISQAYGPEGLQAQARMGNEARTGHSVMETARNVRNDVEAGASYTEAAKTQSMGNEAWGQSGSSKAKRYHDIAYIPEGSRAYELVSQGVIDERTAAIIGSGIRRNVLSTEDANAMASRILNGNLTQAEATIYINDVVKMRNAGQKVNVEEMGDMLSAYREAEGRRAAKMTVRNKAINDHKALVRTEKQTGLNGAQKRRKKELEQQLLQMADDLGIDRSKYLNLRAKPTAGLDVENIATAPDVPAPRASGYPAARYGAAGHVRQCARTSRPRLAWHHAEPAA